MDSRDLLLRRHVQAMMPQWVLGIIDVAIAFSKCTSMQIKLKKFSTQRRGRSRRFHRSLLGARGRGVLGTRHSIVYKHRSYGFGILTREREQEPDPRSRSASCRPRLIRPDPISRGCYCYCRRCPHQRTHLPLRSCTREMSSGVKVSGNHRCSLQLPLVLVLDTMNSLP